MDDKRANDLWFYHNSYWPPRDTVTAWLAEKWPTWRAPETRPPWFVEEWWKRFPSDWLPSDPATDFEGLEAPSMGRISDDESESEFLSLADVHLPEEPTVKNIADIADVLANAPPMHKEQIATILLSHDWAYLRKLGEVFSDCEDLEDHESLALLAEVFRGLVHLNDAAMYEALLSDDLWMGFVGAMEYDLRQGTPVLPSNMDIDADEAGALAPGGY